MITVYLLRFGKLGLNPTRSRRCKGRACFRMPLWEVPMGRRNRAMTPEPENRRSE